MINFNSKIRRLTQRVSEEGTQSSSSFEEWETEVNKIRAVFKTILTELWMRYCGEVAKSTRAQNI